MFSGGSGFLTLMFSEGSSSFTLMFSEGSGHRGCLALMFSEGSGQVCSGPCNLLFTPSEELSVLLASLSDWLGPARTLEEWRRSSLESRESKEMSLKTCLAWSESELDNWVGAVKTRSSRLQLMPTLRCSTGAERRENMHNLAACTLALGPLGSEGEGLTSFRGLFPHSPSH